MNHELSKIEYDPPLRVPTLTLMKSKGKTFDDILGNRFDVLGVVPLGDDKKIRGNGKVTQV